MIVEPITEKEQIEALRKLLLEAIVALRYRSLTQPSASVSSVIERACVALGITERDLTS